MKKAVVVGGSNGIGLAICKQLEKEGYYLYVCDRIPPEAAILNTDNYQFIECDLMDFHDDIFDTLSQNKSITMLIITAGIGRIADFEAHHIAEINKTIGINLLSTIKILRIFYSRIRSKEAFYTCVMGSISGWISSPAASVYAASKAGVVRFIESVNIELEANGYDNRILDVSPGSFKGSRFYGGNNNLSYTLPLAQEIIEKLRKRDVLFIPQYEEIFKKVISEYQSNPHEYGIYSYEYKKNSNRLNNNKKVVIGYLSGTFDLFHVGHLNLLRKAKQHCDYLIVGVHDSGAWKGKETFIPLNERKQIVAACKYVDMVVDSCREDSDAWDLWHYDKLFVGSDYKGTERFIRYEKILGKKGVEIVYFPYTQGTSSTQIREKILSKT